MSQYPVPGTKVYDMCAHLYRHGPISITQLANMFGVTRPAAGYLLRVGYASRTKDDKNIQISKRIRDFFKNGSIAPAVEVPVLENIVPPAVRNVFKGTGFVPQYMQCLREQPEWAKRDEFSKALA